MRKSVFLVPALLVLLTACSPVAREPDNLALVRVLGVDGKSSVGLSAVCGKDSGGNVMKGFAQSADFERARAEVVWSGSGKELSLTGVSHLVIGPDVELETLLLAILRDADLGASAKVWLATEGAYELLEACKDPAADLELLELKRVKAPSVAQAAAALSTDGSVTMPILNMENGRLKEGGWIVWRKNG